MQLQSIKGMHDLLPDQSPAWHRLEHIAAALFAAYDYREIRTPLVEQTRLFERAIGQATDVVEKEMYAFEDRGGDHLSLRPEGTAGVVRSVLQHGLLYAQPLRLWYAGPMFRRERPQRGRTRQFHQIGAEVFGYQGPLIEAELIAMARRLWHALGLGGIELQINSLGSSEERARYRDALVDYLQDYRDALDADSRDRLGRNPLRILDSKNEDTQRILAAAPVLSDSLGAESREHFERLKELLHTLDIEFTVNPRLVRGLDYYSHTVFEWVTDELGAQGTVCAGGRYDSLVEIQGGKPWPGVGFALGMERVVELMNDQTTIGAQAPHVYLVVAGAEAEKAGLALAERLRSAVPELRLAFNAGAASFKAQFKRADRSGAQYALVLGQEELAQHRINLKPLRRDAAQRSMSESELIEWLADALPADEEMQHGE